MQGQDSVEIRADVELGGSEQLFNLNMGRELQKDAGQEPQVCITMPILRGLDGERRMGKSLGNYVGVGEPAYDQFAKAMSIPDSIMGEWFMLLTDRSPSNVRTLTNEGAGPEDTHTHPMVAKKMLGREIVTAYHGADAAHAAQAEWERRFSMGQDPSDIPVIAINAADLVDGTLPIGKLLVLLGLVKSGNEARQKVTEGAVTVGPDRTKIADPKVAVPVLDGLIVRLGTKKVVKVKLG
jgi:tyrosyl-tRNA synthetase